MEAARVLVLWCTDGAGARGWRVRQRGLGVLQRQRVSPHLMQRRWRAEEMETPEQQLAPLCPAGLTLSHMDTQQEG